MIRTRSSRRQGVIGVLPARLLPMTTPAVLWTDVAERLRPFVAHRVPASEIASLFRMSSFACTAGFQLSAMTAPPRGSPRCVRRLRT